MPAASTGLAHVTVSAPNRRVDIALPDNVPLAELFAELLRHAGEGLADQGERHGGWLLRRADGTVLQPAAHLAVQGVRDGAVLHLVPARAEWPELEYDDVVEAIAEGARRHGLAWSPKATRATGLVVAGLALAVALAGVAINGSAPVALLVAAVLLAGGTGASRAYGDAVLGAVLAFGGLPFAFIGGGLLGDPALWRVDSLLVGSGATLLGAVLAAIGVAHALRLFVAAATAAFLGGIGALIAMQADTQGSAASVLAVLVAGVAAVPLLAIRLGKLPMPALSLPTATAARHDGRSLDAPGALDGPDLTPDRARVFAAVARTDEMLTGMLTGIGAVAVCASAFLVLEQYDAWSLILVGVAAAAFLLRARLFVTVRQRLPLLGAGVFGLGLLAVGAARWGGASWMAPGVVVVAAAALIVAISAARYATKPPSPYLGRAADLIDALCVVSVIPLACAVIGLYGLARNLV